MAIYKNEGQHPVKVQYKKAGKIYNEQRGDGAVYDDGDRTSYPFEEVQVAVGGSVDLGEIVWQDVIELTPFSEATQKSLGTLGEQNLDNGFVADPNAPKAPFSEATQKSLDEWQANSQRG